jgi:hypothetical protein
LSLFLLLFLIVALFACVFAEGVVFWPGRRLTWDLRLELHKFKEPTNASGMVLIIYALRCHITAQLSWSGILPASANLTLSLASRRSFGPSRTTSRTTPIDSERIVAFGKRAVKKWLPRPFPSSYAEQAANLRNFPSIVRFDKLGEELCRRCQIRLKFASCRSDKGASLRRVTMTQIRLGDAHLLRSSVGRGCTGPHASHSNEVTAT